MLEIVYILGVIELKFEEFEVLLQDSDTVIVLDTNVILDLARHSLHTSKNILNIFYECFDLIWIPNQVFKEYNKNKHSVFGSLRKRYRDLECNLISTIESFEYRVNNTLKNSNRYNYVGNNKLSRDIEEKIKELKNIVKSYKDTVGIEYDEITSDSPEIIKEIELFVSELERNGQIGNKTGVNKLLEILKEGELRYKFNIPPGFKDDSKDGVAKFGDLFVWKEIMKLPTMLNIKHVIFLTNDEKDDWWDKEKKDKININRWLKEEFIENNPNTSIDFMTINSFQENASKLYDLYELEVYIDLNRNDESFIDRASCYIVNDIISKISADPYNYLDSCKIGSQGIDVENDLDYSFKGKKELFSEFFNNEVLINYEIIYDVELFCTSYEYLGRDDDTKNVISLPITHIFKGDITASIYRYINAQDVKLNPNILNEDIEYEFVDIVESCLTPIEVISEEDLYFDEEF